MFIGHFAVGFASKKWAPGTNMAVLIAAPLFLDILWLFFLLLGWEKVRADPGNTRFTPLDFVWYPWSHSLVMSIVWATALAGGYWAMTRYRPGVFVIWAAVVSHWVLDWVTHRADMPLYPGSQRFGVGLWNSIAGTMTVELTIFALGIWVYIRTTRRRDRIGRYALLAYVIFLLGVYVGDRFGDSPSGPIDIRPAILAEFVLLFWAGWFDRHRMPVAVYSSDILASHRELTRRRWGGS